MNLIGWFAFVLILVGHFLAIDTTMALMAQPNGFDGTWDIVQGWMPSMIMSFGGFVFYAWPWRGSVLPGFFTVLFGAIAFLSCACIIAQSYGYGKAPPGPVWAFLLLYLVIVVLGYTRLRKEMCAAFKSRKPETGEPAGQGQP